MRNGSSPSMEEQLDEEKREKNLQLGSSKLLGSSKVFKITEFQGLQNYWGFQRSSKLLNFRGVIPVRNFGSKVFSLFKKVQRSGNYTVCFDIKMQRPAILFHVKILCHNIGYAKLNGDVSLATNLDSPSHRGGAVVNGITLSMEEWLVQYHDTIE
ncbi:hypothetical protein SUGI_0716300 [Cryptomeria japonica]|nr:hypothetical protein SUGI_0716300 [Cryptomeria japonica]